MTIDGKECPQCGYVMTPFDEVCPRCARRAKAACQLCGQIGVVGECEECHKQVCAACAVRQEGGFWCRQCRPDLSPAMAAPVADRPPLEISDAPLGGLAAPAQFAGPRPLGVPFPVRHSTGFWDSVTRAFTFIGQSVAMVRRSGDLILPAIFGFVANAVFLGLVLAALWGAGVWEQIAKETSQGRTYAAIIGAVLTFCMYLISYFFTAMTVHLVDVHLKGQDARLGRAFADASKNLLAIVALAVVSTLVSLLTQSLRRNRGGVGNWIGGAIQRAWTVATFLLLPVIILEDVSLGRALGRARHLHSRNFVPIAVGEVAVSLVAGLITFVALVIAVVGVVALFGAVGTTGLTIGIVIFGLFFAAVMAFAQYLRTAYYTCLYLWAAAQEVEGEGARAPAPLAAALGA